MYLLGVSKLMLVVSMQPAASYFNVVTPAGVLEMGWILC